MDWPDWFPDGCPPEDSVEAAGEFYRLVRGEVVVEEDFWSFQENHDAGRGRKSWTPDKDIEAAACSVFQTREDADHAQQSSGSMRSKRVAVGQIDGGGVMKATPNPRHSSHHSWWRRVGDTAWTTFGVAS